MVVKCVSAVNEHQQDCFLSLNLLYNTTILPKYYYYYNLSAI